MEQDSFKNILDKSIDAGIDSAVDSNEDIKRLKKLESKAETLKDQIKASIKEEFTEDLVINADEWEEIYNSISPSLLRSLGINNSYELEISITETPEGLLVQGNTDEFFERALEFTTLDNAEELFEAAALKDPFSAMEHFDLYKTQPYAKDILINTTDTYFTAVKVNYDKFIDQPYAEEVFTKISKKDPGRFLNTLHDTKFAAGIYEQIIQKPYWSTLLESTMRTLADKDPRYLAIHFDDIKNEPYAQELIQISAEKSPESVLRQYKKIQDQPYAEKILEQAVKELAKETQCWPLIRDFQHYADQPYAEEILDLVSKNAPSRILNNLEDFQDKPYSKRIIKQAVDTLVAQEEHSSLLIHADTFKTEDYAHEVILKAANEDILTCFDSITNFADQPYTEQVLKSVLPQIVEQEEYAKFIVMKCFDELIALNAPYTKRVIQKAIEVSHDKYPSITVKYAEKYPDIVDEDTLEKATRLCIQTHPITILENHNYISSKPYGEEVIKSALKNAPAVQLTNYIDTYIDKPYAEEIIEKRTADILNSNTGFTLSKIKTLQEYSKHDCIKTLLNKLILKEPRDFLMAYSPEHSSIDLAILAARQILSDQPRDAHTIIDFAIKYKGIPGEILLKAAETTKKHHEEILRIANLYPETEKDKLIEKIIRQDIETDAQSAAKIYVHLYIDQPYAEKILNKICEKNPSGLSYRSSEITGKPFAKNIFIKLARKTPVAILESINNYIDQDYAEEIIRIAARKKPRVAITQYHKFVEKPYAESILKNCFLHLSATELSKYYGIEVSNDLTEISDAKRDFIEQNYKKFFQQKDRLIDRNVYIDRDGFNQDPALKNFDLINPDWLDPSPEPWKVAQYRMILARNLYFQEKEITQDNVKNEYLRVLEAQEEMSSTTIFKDRNVLMSSHNELNTWDRFKGEHLFGRDEVQDEIRQQGGELTALRPDQTYESLKHNKEKTLQSIINTSPPFTFMFSGHGGPDAIYFSDGQPKNTPKAPVEADIVETENTVKITVQEFAEAYIKRHEQHGDPKTPDIIILACCYSHTFIRDFYKILEDANVKPPITLGIAEYNQLGAADITSAYGYKFHKQVLDFGSNTTTTIGTIIENEFKHTTSNPSLYIPTTEGHKMQIAKGQIGPGRHNIATG